MTQSKLWRARSAISSGYFDLEGTQFDFAKNHPRWPGSKAHFGTEKCSKKTLPAVQDLAAAAGLKLKRMLLPQGELAQIHDADESLHYLAFIELREGGTRGNHYHRNKKEYIYVIQGELQLVMEDVNTRERATLSLQTGDLASIQPGVAHVLRTIHPGQAIEFSPARYDPTDTCRCIL